MSILQTALRKYRRARSMGFKKASEEIVKRLKRRANEMANSSPGFLTYTVGDSVYRLRHDGVGRFPQTLSVGVSDACNLDCVMCPRQAMTWRGGLMDTKLFRKIIDECAKYNVREVALIGFGEPLLHPGIIEMSRYAKTRRIRSVYTSTNCTLLSEEISKEILVNSGFDKITLSLDGASKETYEKLRVRSNYDEVTAKIAYFLDLKKRLGLRKPVVWLQILRMEDTEAEISDFVRLWKPYLGFWDEIFVKDMDTMGGLVEDMRTEAQIALKAQKERIPCQQLWKYMSIAFNGDVTVCCKDANYRLKVGNANESTLRESWLSERWQKIRDVHARGEYDKIVPCKNCHTWDL